MLIFQINTINFKKLNNVYSFPCAFTIMFNLYKSRLKIRQAYMKSQNFALPLQFGNSHVYIIR